VALAREELGAARSSLAGRVSIGLPPSLSRLVTVPLTLALQATMPHARVTLTEGFSVSMYEGLRVGNLDLALLYNPEPAPELDMQTVHEDELVLISPRKNAPESGIAKALSFSEITDLSLILPSRPNAFRLLLDQAFGALNRRAQVVIEVDGLNAILSLVAHGVGHAVLPQYTLANFERIDPFAVTAIHSPRLVSQLQLVWSARRPATATQRQALVVVNSVVSDHLIRASNSNLVA
jgi:LysR family nitrogen assimilation transcriptional regulator